MEQIIETKEFVEKLFFSAETGGFYSNAIHTEMPADAVEITKEDHQAFLEGQSKGKVIASKNGKPVLQDHPAPTAEQLQEQTNAKARAYLAETDWYVVRKAETGVGIPADILAKRAEARASVK